MNQHRDRLRQLRAEFAKLAEDRALKELLAEAAYHAKIAREMAGKNWGPPLLVGDNLSRTYNLVRQSLQNDPKNS